MSHKSRAVPDLPLSDIDAEREMRPHLACPEPGEVLWEVPIDPVIIALAQVAV